MKAIAILIVGLAAACAKPAPSAPPGDAPLRAEEPTPPQQSAGSPATPCDEAKMRLRNAQAAIPYVCSTRADCGFADFAYESCENPSVVSLKELTADTRSEVEAALEFARAQCAYVAAPCPAVPVGDPICVAGWCDGSLRALMRAPSIQLELTGGGRALRAQPVDFTVSSGDPGGPRTHRLESDPAGRIAVPTEWLGAPRSSFSIVAGKKRADFASLADLLEASATPIKLTSEAK